MSYHSPPLALLSLLGSWLLPAAAEAKLEGSGEGIVTIVQGHQIRGTDEEQGSGGDIPGTRFFVAKRGREKKRR